MSWHERSCGIPELSWAGGYPTCIRCGSSASSIAKGSVVTPPPPPPPPCPKRSQLVCSWPPCVEYSDSYIDEKGNDVTAFIIENIDGWEIDRFEVPDDQANFQEVREPSHQTEGSSEPPVLPMACSDTTTYASGGVAQTTHDKIHTVASGLPSTDRSDRIHEHLSGSDDFRLLQLHGSASFDDPIHCTLEVAQLDDPDVPLYEALSYTWADLDGDKRNCMPIYIGCHFDVLLVTKNCESALRRLRKRTNRLLWIDSICINQNDPVERSTQVSHMAKIYSNASRVRIYLGEADRGSEEAFGIAATYTQKEKILEDTVSLAELARRPYFKRLWIIQEVALAVRASVTCGGSTTHWTDLCSALQWCGAAPAWMKHFLAPVYARRETPSVLELLQDTRGALCIDPRDRLFAIIGLANREERECLPTDYSLSVQQLYTGLAAYWIQKTEIRCFLKLACDQRKLVPGLPSWVPDWTNMETQESGSTMPQLHIGSYYAASPQLFWRDESGQELKSSNSFPGSNIFTKGRIPSITDLFVQTNAGALHLHAAPLFRISCGELKTHKVVNSMRITNWRMHDDSKPFDHTKELEIFAIPSYNGILILKKHDAEIFSLRGVVSIILDGLNEHGLNKDGLNEYEAWYWSLNREENANLRRWLRTILGLCISSNYAYQDSNSKHSTHKAAFFPDGPVLTHAAQLLRIRYKRERYKMQKSNQTGFSSGQFQAMDLMRTIMVDAIDAEDLAWPSSIDWSDSTWDPIDTSRILTLSVVDLEDFAMYLPTRKESIDEQISTWSSSITQLRSQLQEQGSFSDAFRALQNDDHFNPIFQVHTKHAMDGAELLKEILGIDYFLYKVEPRFAHLSLFLRMACSVISSATLDENLPWDYNRDRFWMCMVSFDLIVRLRLLLAHRQLLSQIQRSISNPERIVIV